MARTPEFDCGTPSDCARILARLEDLLRGELCERESAPLLRHIRECPECQEEQAALKRLTAAVQRACHDTRAPLSLREAIIAGIQRDAHYRDLTEGEPASDETSPEG